MAEDFPTDEELAKAGWFRLSRRERRINSAPRRGQFFWVDFPHDAYEPEFIGEHPGVVLRGGNLLHGTCIVVPVTSREPAIRRYVHKFGTNPNPQGEKSGIEAFAICDHLYTVNVCRLRPVLDLKGQPVFGKVSPEDLFEIERLVVLALFPPGPGGGSRVTLAAEVSAPQKEADVAASPETNRLSARKILGLPKAKR